MGARWYQLFTSLSIEPLAASHIARTQPFLYSLARDADKLKRGFYKRGTNCTTWVTFGFTSTDKLKIGRIRNSRMVTALHPVYVCVCFGFSLYYPCTGFQYFPWIRRTRQKVSSPHNTHSKKAAERRGGNTRVSVIIIALPSFLKNVDPKNVNKSF